MARSSQGFRDSAWKAGSEDTERRTDLRALSAQRRTSRPGEALCDSGLESGGSLGDVGRCVTFTNENREPLEYLHPVETIAVNGLHAVVISTAMLRADLLRKGRTYELLITRHWLSLVTDGKKRPLECEIVFHWHCFFLITVA